MIRRPRATAIVLSVVLLCSIVMGVDAQDQQTPATGVQTPAQAPTVQPNQPPTVTPQAPTVVPPTGTTPSTTPVVPSTGTTPGLTQPVPATGTVPAIPTTGTTPTVPPAIVQPLPPGTAAGGRAPVADGAAVPGPCIPLQQAVDMALANNPQITTALEQIERARGVVNEARARGRVNVNANAVYTLQGPQQTIPFFNVETQQLENINVIQTSNTTAQINAIQPLDIFGRIRLATQVARLNERVQAFNLQSTASDLALNVKTAYYNVLRAYGQRDTAQSAVNVANEQLRIARAQYEAGTVARFDVTQAEVRVANLEQVLISATNAVILAKASLNTLLGRPANTPIEVQQQIVTIPDVRLNTDTLVQTAYTTRPEVQAAQTSVQAAQENIRLTRLQLAPSVALTGGTNWTQKTQGFASNNVTWQLGAAVSVPIFDGGVTKAQVQQARATAGIAEAQLVQTRLGVSLDVENAVTNVRNAVERVANAQANVTLAEESLRLAQVRYEAQVGTLVEVQQAESSLNEARIILVNANFDYLVGVAQLQRAIGVETIAAIPSTPATPTTPTPTTGS